MRYGFVTTLSTKFPSPRGVELHKPCVCNEYKGTGFALVFPSPRGVELHKPRRLERLCAARMRECFRPLAGLSCINRVVYTLYLAVIVYSFRPLAGLSCINPGVLFKVVVWNPDWVSVPSRG